MAIAPAILDAAAVADAAVTGGTAAVVAEVAAAAIRPPPLGEPRAARSPHGMRCLLVIAPAAARMTAAAIGMVVEEVPALILRVGKEHERQETGEAGNTDIHQSSSPPSASAGG